MSEGAELLSIMESHAMEMSTNKIKGEDCDQCREVRADNRKLREALEEAAYLLQLKDLDGNWLVDPTDPEDMNAGEMRVYTALMESRDE